MGAELELQESHMCVAWEPKVARPTHTTQSHGETKSDCLSRWFNPHHYSRVCVLFILRQTISSTMNTATTSKHIYAVADIISLKKQQLHIKEYGIIRAVRNKLTQTPLPSDIIIPAPFEKAYTQHRRGL